MIDVADLDARFTHLADEYGARKAAAYGAVVRWEWYDNEAFDLRPLWYERHLFRRGHRLEGRPPLTFDHYRLGFDADDRPVVSLEHSGFLRGTLYYETFRTYQADVVEEARFYADGRPIYLHAYGFDRDRITSAVSAAIAGGGYETYDYDDDQVSRIIVHHADRKSGSLGHLVLRSTIDADYDVDGLVRLEVTDAGYPSRTQYERPPAGFDTAVACLAVQQHLTAQIPRVVAALDIEEPAYCIALVYDNAYDPAGTAVHVGLEEDRQAYLADDVDPDVVWSPADMAHSVDIDAGAVVATARLLAQELALAGTAMSRDVAHAAAQTLNARDWSTILPVSEDFIVFAIDLEMVDLDRNLPGRTDSARV